MIVDTLAGLWRFGFGFLFGCLSVLVFCFRGSCRVLLLAIVALHGGRRGDGTGARVLSLGCWVLDGCTNGCTKPATPHLTRGFTRRVFP